MVVNPLSQTPQSIKEEKKVEAASKPVILSKKIKRLIARVHRGDKLNPEEQKVYDDFLALWNSKKPE
jgi:hypothetical protein